MKTYKYKPETEQAMSQGDFKKAILLYTKALALDPNNAMIYSERGVCYLNMEEHELALQDLDIAVTFEPNNPYRYSSRAFLKGAMKNTQGAIDDYKKAVELDPEDAISYNNLGLQEEQLGYWQKAKKNFEVADELAGILKENKILTSEHPLYEKEIDSKKEEIISNDMKNKATIGTTFKKVLTSKESFKEFLSFVKNGFKIPKN